MISTLPTSIEVIDDAGPKGKGSLTQLFLLGVDITSA